MTWWTPPDADAAARQVAAAHRLSAPRRVSIGPPAWVYVTDTAVIRLVVDDDPPARLAAVSQLVALVRALREHGAPLAEFLGPPLRVGPAVATVSQLLSGPAVSSADFGAALAALHEAGAGPEVHPLAPPFDPLAPARRTYEHLFALAEQDKTFTAGDAAFPAALLPRFRDCLGTAAEAAAQAVALTHARGRGLTVLHADVHPGNVRADPHGQAVLIDLDDLMAGPAEYDLARPLGQWVSRFGRPAAMVSAFRDGYQRRGGQVDDDVLALALIVSEARFGAALVTLAVEASLRGQQPDEWTLAEGVRRLKHLHDPDARWRSREEELSLRPPP